MMTEPKHKLTIKIGDSLRTVQADTYDEFVEELAKVHDDLQACHDLIVAARAVGAIAQTPASTESTTQHAAPSAPAAFTNASVPQCQHGPKTAKTGASGKGPWKAWMCSAPKGDPTQCAPQWIQRGTPEWSNFPA